LGEVEPDQIEIRFDDMRKIILVLIFVFVVSGCGTTVNPGPLPTEINTPLPQPTVASSPTAIPLPSAVGPTSEPPLKTSGPYFTYFRQVNGAYQLVMMDADGVGQKAVDLPQGFVDSLTNQQYGLDMKFVSPDGKWLAFYTGFAGKNWFDPEIGDGPFNLTLKLLDLTTGDIQVITPLLSKDYPDNFTKAEKQINDPHITNIMLRGAFLSGLTQSIAWSPDGEHLAFAGQMDGLSSDLYVYDITTKATRRLSSGEEELQWIEWSPDGKWIVHGSTYWAGEGMSFDVYVAAVDGSSVIQVSTTSGSSGIRAWLNSQEYFENDAANGPGQFDLRLVDINTGRITKIWDGSFDSYDVDKSGKWVAVFANSLDANPFSDFVPAIYLINLITLNKSRVEFPDNSHSYRFVNSFGSIGQDFVLLDSTSKKVLFLSIDGKWTQTDFEDVQLSVSPNSKYWLAITDQEFKIFSADNTLIKTNFSPLPIGPLNFSWRFDSSGLFIISETRIYSMNIPNGDINAVEVNLLDNSDSTYNWINSQ
jgi:hypothetical protein